MEPLQLIAYASSDHGRKGVLDSLPDAPRVPYVAAEHRSLGVRTHLAGLLRRTADRVDPCPAPAAG